jgi:hypothetical protein
MMPASVSLGLVVFLVSALVLLYCLAVRPK